MHRCTRSASVLCARSGPVAICLTLIVSLVAVPSCGRALPPDQPTTGPGGADYTHASVTQSTYGEEGEQYWLIEPNDPAPESAPLIVFNHGWAGMLPGYYAAWIEHIVRRGNIVLFPRYQASLSTPPSRFLPNAIQAATDGVARLQDGRHVRPDLDRFALVGHSMGGQLTANMAAVAADVGLPTPGAVMCAEPGGPKDDVWWHHLFEDLSQIPAGTLLLTLVGDADRFVGETGARMIYEGATQIPAQDKDFVVLVSDDYGQPHLVANHLAPVAMMECNLFAPEFGISLLTIDVADLSVNALDTYGTWKLFDALTDAAFYGTNRQYALGDTPEQRFMGEWSDGTPVRELVVTDDP